MQRSSFLQTSIALAACGTVACSSQAGASMVEMPDQFSLSAFDKLVNKAADVHQVWDAGPLHPQILGGVKNSLNGLQFGFGVKPDRIAVAFVTHNESNLMLYDDTMWAKYQLGQLFGVRDPGGNVVSANIFSPARSTMNIAADPNDVRGYYQDAAIETLQKRGVKFFVCNTALVQQAQQISSSAKGGVPNDIANDLRTHLLPGVMLVPSGVGTIAYLQSRYHYGYTTEQA